MNIKPKLLLSFLNKICLSIEHIIKQGWIRSHKLMLNQEPPLGLAYGKKHYGYTDGKMEDSVPDTLKLILLSMIYHMLTLSKSLSHINKMY